MWRTHSSRYAGLSGVFLRVPLLLGTDFDGAGHIRQKTDLHRRLRRVLPADRNNLRSQGG